MPAIHCWTIYADLSFLWASVTLWEKIQTGLKRGYCISFSYHEGQPSPINIMQRKDVCWSSFWAQRISFQPLTSQFLEHRDPPTVAVLTKLDRPIQSQTLQVWSVLDLSLLNLPHTGNINPTQRPLWVFKQQRGGNIHGYRENIWGMTTDANFCCCITVQFIVYDDELHHNTIYSDTSFGSWINP